MGVSGLWKLIGPCGQPVPVEILQNKVLAVDISIWLHQVVKGFQDSKGSALSYAHLLGLFHRLCKLLYYGIRPVFVFDGKVAPLKREIIAKRIQQRNKLISEAERIEPLLLQSLVKEKVVLQALGSKAADKLFKVSPGKKNHDKSHEFDIFTLPSLQHPEKTAADTECDWFSEVSSRLGSSRIELKPQYQNNQNLQDIDVSSKDFQNLPADIRHEILIDIKETRKQSSWGKIHELPSKSKDFSTFQMKRLLKRRQVQDSITQVEKEMDGVRTCTLSELESIFNEEGIIKTTCLGYSKHISSDAHSRYLLMRDLKHTLANGAFEKSDLTTDLTEQTNPQKEELQTSLDKSETYSKNENEYKSICSNNTEQGSGVDNAGVEFTTASLFHLADVNNEDYLETSRSQSKHNIINTTTESLKTENMEKSINAPKNITYVLEEKQQENTNIVGVISDSNSDSDLEEVKEVSHEVKKNDSHKMEIFVDPSNNINPDNDLFFGIFKPTEKIINDKRLLNESEIFEDLRKQASDATKITLSEIKLNRIPENKECIENVLKITSPLKFCSDTIQRKRNAVDNDYDSHFPKINKESELSLENKCCTEKLEITNKQGESDFIVAASALKKIKSPEELDDILSQITKNKIDLEKEKNRQDRLGMTITEKMNSECMQLLRLFGIPFIVAPMEAEAQCAFLEVIGLTNGTITDDSDIWLFGGRTVYKNFFAQNKHVMRYNVDTIERIFNLDRNKLIQLALLVGSDYTTGINGIGAVTALEILGIFSIINLEETVPSDQTSTVLKSLKNFQKCWESTKANSVIKSSIPQRIIKKLKSIDIYEGFPNAAVVEAYLKPEVDSHQKTFSWGKLEIESIREFARANFGWTKLKTDETLEPVLKKLNDKKTQLAITNYFTTKTPSYSKQVVVSKRVQSAIKNMSTDNKNVVQAKTPPKKKTKTKALPIETDTKNIPGIQFCDNFQKPKTTSYRKQDEVETKKKKKKY